MRLGHFALTLMLLILVSLIVLLFGVLWVPLLLFLLAVGVSLWLVRRYYMDYLDEPEEQPARR